MVATVTAETIRSGYRVLHLQRHEDSSRVVSLVVHEHEFLSGILRLMKCGRSEGSIYVHGLQLHSCSASAFLVPEFRELPHDLRAVARLVTRLNHC